MKSFNAHRGIDSRFRFGVTDRLHIAISLFPIHSWRAECVVSRVNSISQWLWALVYACAPPKPPPGLSRRSEVIIDTTSGDDIDDAFCGCSGSEKPRTGNSRHRHNVCDTEAPPPKLSIAGLATLGLSVFRARWHANQTTNVLNQKRYAKAGISQSAASRRSGLHSRHIFAAILRQSLFVPRPLMNVGGSHRQRPAHFSTEARRHEGGSIECGYGSWFCPQRGTRRRWNNH